MANIMNEWPEWAWVSRHAEDSKCDHLAMTGPGSGHVFPHAEPMWYCNRSWGPQEYIEYRLKMLQAMAEDVQRVIELFSEPEARVVEQHPLIAETIGEKRCYKTLNVKK